MSGENSRRELGEIASGADDEELEGSSMLGASGGQDRKASGSLERISFKNGVYEMQLA